MKQSTHQPFCYLPCIAYNVYHKWVCSLVLVKFDASVCMLFNPQFPVSLLAYTPSPPSLSLSPSLCDIFTNKDQLLHDIMRISADKQTMANKPMASFRNQHGDVTKTQQLHIQNVSCNLRTSQQRFFSNKWSFPWQQLPKWQEMKASCLAIVSLSACHFMNGERLQLW